VVSPPSDAARAQLVLAAANGDPDAWDTLVERFDRLLRTVARGFRLAPADVDDVAQATWLKALEQIHRINDPDAIGGWLVITARREALKSLQRRVREVPSDDIDRGQDECACPVAAAVQSERTRALRVAVGRLPRGQRRLFGAMLATPDPSYEQLSAALGIPVGSIGPTRRRALDALRQDEALLRAVS
jgi:RNA polymerase sigma factor (sigma-70 family)